MPVNFSTLHEKTHTVTAEYASESVGVTFYPHRVTKSFLRETNAVMRQDDRDGTDRLIAQLARLVKSWEVVDDKGKEVPPTVENMEAFPVDFLQAVMLAINTATVPGEGNGASSSTT